MSALYSSIMRLTLNVFTCFAVINVNIRSVLTLHEVENCSLLASELGPDWYKVSRPVPPGIDGKPAYEPSKVHMPCAKGTVFDIGVCGCTSLMSFIFTTVNKRKQIHHEIEGGDKVDPDDFIKRVDDSTTQRPPAGSILINTRTGEVKECPFRASSRGPRWYLIREPRDQWRHMICAAGTVFEKRRCTCVHKLMARREPEKPEDANIVIIEEDWATGDKTISKSLGISVADVDFSVERRPDDIPFWRRQDLFASGPKEERRIFNGKSDVTVTLNNHEFSSSQNLHESVDGLDIGQDKISDAHKNLFFKGSRSQISHKRTQISPLVLDSNLDKTFDQNNNLHFRDNGAPLLIHAKKFNTQKPSFGNERKVLDTNDVLNVLNQISSKIDALDRKKGAAIDIVPKSVKGSGNEAPTANGLYEEVFDKMGCSKKPLPELGPQYFLLDVINLGYIPFTCHGNTIYNDTLCACIPAPEDTVYDEAIFPVKECRRRAFPELGPQYFLDHLLGVGYIPYVCYGNMIYDENMCACV